MHARYHTHMEGAVRGGAGGGAGGWKQNSEK